MSASTTSERGCTELGRFLQPDPLLGDPLRPKTLNPYSYATNDPLNPHDPTGLQAEVVPLIEGLHNDFNKSRPEPPPPGVDLAIGEIARSEFGADDHLRGAQPVTPARLAPRPKVIHRGPHRPRRNRS